MQTTTKLFRSLGGSPLLTFAVSLLGLPFSIGALAQSSEVAQTASTVAAVVPQQVRYAGALSNRGGETVEAVFRIYATAEGGEALWTETQRVAVGADGAYTVLLGAASQSGLPQAVFAGGQARWVGVTVDRAEGVRSPLSSVAYAMKAGDAESVGGLSAANLVTKDDLAKLAQATAAVQPQPQGVQQAVTPTGSGTADYVALWTAAGNLGDSNIFQASSGFLGIGTTTPGGPLELATSATGGANATLMLEQTNGTNGNYYADLGLYNSNGLIGNLSALGAGYPAGNIYGANDVVFLGGQQNATTNVLLLTNTGGALKFGTGGYAKTDERMRIGKTGGISIGNSYVTTDPGAGNLIVSGNVGVGTTAPAAVLEVNGTAKFDGLVSFGAGQTFPGAIAGVTTTSPLTSSETSGTVTVGLSTSTLETTLNGVYAQLGASDTFSKGLVADQSLGGGYAAVNAQGTSGSMGVLGSSDTGTGVAGTVTTPADGSSGVLGSTGTTFSNNYTSESAFYAGIRADTSSTGASGLPAALLATADDGFGGAFVNSSADDQAVYGYNYMGGGGYFLAVGQAGVGVEAYALNDHAGSFQNDGTATTLYVYNSGSGGLGNASKGTPGMFDTLMATSASGTCGIGGGSMSCTGPVKSLVSTEGSRTVETYATQSPENWMEDYGSGAMERGVGMVQIDPAFADTVTADTSYRVFLTPLGDLKGPLYVTKVSANTFEVREANGGTSSISFDYKIVAKRRGYEGQRLVDVTDRFNAAQATKRRSPAANAVGAGKGAMPRAAVVNRNAGHQGGSALPAPVVRQNPIATQKPM